MERTITDDLDLLLGALPPHICEPLKQRDDNFELLEVVMDLGRRPEARYPGREVTLAQTEVTAEDIDYVVARIEEFGDDNRAGIERTLHRISCIRNRRGRIVGLTCRVGRAVSRGGMGGSVFSHGSPSLRDVEQREEENQTMSTKCQ